MKKRILALALSVATIMSLVGCNVENNKNTNEPTTTTNENNNSEEFLSYFPDKLELDNSKFICIDNSMSISGETMDICIKTGYNEGTTYMSFAIIDAFEFKMLTQDNNNYAYFDMYSSLKSMMTNDELEELKKEYANEKGVDVSTITDEEFDNALREKAISFGYTDLSLDVGESDYDMSFDKDSIAELQSSYVNQEKVNSLISSYNKENLKYVKSENGTIVASYEVSGFEDAIEIGIDEKTKEVVSIAFCYSDKGEITYNIQMTFSDFDLDKIGIDWATKDTSLSVEEVSETMMMALMMITMGQVQ